MKLRSAFPVMVPALVVVLAAPAYAAVSYNYSDAAKRYSANGDTSADNIVISCVAGEVQPVTAPVAPCSTLEAIQIYPNDGADDVDLTGVTAADFPELVDIYISDEDDFVRDDIFGSDLDEEIVVGSADRVEANGGNDVIEGGAEVDGGDGDDVLIEAGSSDGANGGPGNDRFVQTLSSGGTDGGTGYDIMEVDFDRTIRPLDGIVITMTGAQLLLELGDVSESAFVTRMEELHVTMPRGDDQTFDAADFPGKIVFRGSRGSDTFVGSAQEDIVSTGKGDDTVQARDGAFDLVDCGEGTDTAVVDAVDRVVNCESVDYPKPSTSKISGPKKIKKGKSATYSFSSSVPGSAFQCRIDKGGWKGCSSPYTVKAKGKLKKGKHTLFVRAGYPAGNWDATPSKKKIKIKK